MPSMPTLPSAPASHCAAVAAYGARRETSCSLPAAAVLDQYSAILVPTSGIRESHSGGGGIGEVASERAHPAIVSALSTSVWIASSNGTTNTSTITPDMMATAKPRRRNLFCSLSIMGHVATTIIIAQIVERRNGRSIQNEPPTSAIISKIASNVRVRSGRGTVVGARLAMVSGFRGSGIGNCPPWLARPPKKMTLDARRITTIIDGHVRANEFANRRRTGTIQA